MSIDRYMVMRRGLALAIVGLVSCLLAVKGAVDTIGWLGYGGVSGTWYSYSLEIQYFMSMG